MSQVMWKRCMTRVADLPEPARNDIEAALRSVDSGFAHLVKTLAEGVGLTGPDRALREDALLFAFASVQVADDLADGDCDYVRDAARAGPGLHWMLQQLFHRCILQSDVPREDAARAADDLVRVGAAQQVEVRVRAWTRSEFETAAAGLNGRQYAAYFRLLAAGTRYAERAAVAGPDFGYALHVVTDIATLDERWRSLTNDEKSAILAEASASVARAREANLPALDRLLARFGTVLGAQAAARTIA